MLVALSIRNIILIDRLDLEFSGGLSVMTGETGAGKSILLDAFALALGARGDASLVRKSEPQGQVTAVFEPDPGHQVLPILAENGIECSGQLILRRVQTPEGATRAFINDQPVSVQLLRRIGAALVEIHGQHDDRALTDAAAHRRLLDAYGGLTADAASVAERHERWQAALRALREHEAHIDSVRANADFLRHALEELTTLDPKLDEEESLAGRRQLMMHAERIAGDLEEAHDALAGAGTDEARLAAVLRKLERQAVNARDIVEPVTASLERLLVEINEARGAIEAGLAAAAFDPAELEASEERLFALRALARKHKVPVADLPGLIGKFEAELEALDAGEHKVASLRKAAEQAAEDYRKTARALSKRRHATAAALDAAVIAELAPLRLDKARFITRIETGDEEEGGPTGLDRVAFWVQTNPGTDPGLLMKVASGGELARFMLALKVVLASRGSAPSLVFDEVDTGVGGATAAAIGQRLLRLSQDMQVIAITHAPQVAALAGAHMRIVKESMAAGDGESVATRVEALEGETRREEIARMLAGQTVTDEARAAAERLMERRA